MAQNEPIKKVRTLSTIEQTTGETIIRMGGTTAGGAVLGAAIGSTIAGPAGTIVGGVVGAASGLFVSASDLLPTKPTTKE